MNQLQPIAHGIAAKHQYRKPTAGTSLSFRKKKPFNYSIDDFLRRHSIIGTLNGCGELIISGKRIC